MSFSECRNEHLPEVARDVRREIHGCMRLPTRASDPRFAHGSCVDLSDLDGTHVVHGVDFSLERSREMSKNCDQQMSGMQESMTSICHITIVAQSMQSASSFYAGQ